MNYVLSLSAVIGYLTVLILYGILWFKIIGWIQKINAMLWWKDCKVDQGFYITKSNLGVFERNLKILVEAKQKRRKRNE